MPPVDGVGEMAGNAGRGRRGDQCPLDGGSHALVDERIVNSRQPLIANHLEPQIRNVEHYPPSSRYSGERAGESGKRRGVPGGGRTSNECGSSNRTGY